MRENPERQAWNILVAAFAVFLTIAGGLIYSAQWFVLRSSVPLNARLTVARGTVRVVLPDSGDPLAVADRRDHLEPGTVIQTDATSQAIITFTEERTGNPVTSVTLFRNSELTILEGSSPRYRLNNRDNRVSLSVQEGRIALLLLRPGESYTTQVGLSTPHAEVNLDDRADITISVTDQSSRISSYLGAVRVASRTTGEWFNLTECERISLGPESGSPEVVATAASLLANPQFRGGYEGSWAFYNDREPAGVVVSQIFDGREVVLIDRSQERFPTLVLSHGETGLVQNLDADVSTDSYLELRATFFVAEQSLSMCGFLGSECPMMLRFLFRDAENNQHEYIQGFYAREDAESEYPRACATCRNEHERINPVSWYTFESGNLMERWPVDQRPTVIEQISLYASGHAYKVYVYEVNLLTAPTTPR